VQMPLLLSIILANYAHEVNLHSSTAMFSIKLYTLEGFEPRSSVPEAAAMSTAPSRRGH
jgi:hypothetical protein